jgi:hypothetical protein
MKQFISIAGAAIVLLQFFLFVWLPAIRAKLRRSKSRKGR